MSKCSHDKELKFSPWAKDCPYCEIARLTERIERITFVMNGLLQNDLDNDKSGALEKIEQILKGETP